MKRKCDGDDRDTERDKRANVSHGESGDRGHHPRLAGGGAKSDSAGAVVRVPAELVTDFRELSARYPDFAAAWSSLKKRRSSREGQGRRADRGRGEANSDDEGGAGGGGGAVSFSTHVNFDFNLSLTRAILHRNFGLSLPSLPRGRLCPPVPNRLNYVLWIGDLLRQSADASYFVQKSPPAARGASGVGGSAYRRRGLDVGTGASAIYPLLLCADRFFSPLSFGDENDDDDRGWRFLATEVDAESKRCAEENLEANGLLGPLGRVTVALVRKTDRQAEVEGGGGSRILQGEEGSGGDGHCRDRAGPVRIALEAARSLPAFRGPGNQGDGVVVSHDVINAPLLDFVMTNPPFYSSKEEASAPRSGDGRARTDMTLSEGVYPGGELGFVTDIIADGRELGEGVTWYTAMLGRKSSLESLAGQLGRELGKGRVRTTEFVQGQTRRWGLAWTYRDAALRSPGESDFLRWLRLSMPELTPKESDHQSFALRQ